MKVYRCIKRFFATPLERYIPVGAVVCRWEEVAKIVVNDAPQTDSLSTILYNGREYDTPELATWISAIEPPPLGTSTEWLELVSSHAEDSCGDAGGAQGPQGPGGGTGATYTNATPTPETIGGIDSGSTFSNRTMQQMWDDLLYPYQAPAFTAFSISGQTDVLEVGDAIPAVSTFVWATSNPANIVANSILIRDVTGSTVLASGLADDGSEVVNMGAPVTKATEASNVFRIEGQNTQLATFTRDKTYNWRWRVYWGPDATTPLVEADIEALANSSLYSGFSRTYSFGTSPGEYKYLSYPAVMGTAVTFRDADTGFTVPFESPYLVSVTNAFGTTTDYRVHRSTNMLGGAINIEVS